jgi:hypothetical protein
MGIFAGLFAGATTAIAWPLNGTIPVLIAGYIINFITIKLVSKLRK